MKKDRLKRLPIILMASLVLTGCADQQEQAEPTPIVVEKPDITQTKREEYLNGERHYKPRVEE